MFVYHIHVQGLVQGVGFRPFVFLLASQMKLNGQVCNNNEGVCIEIECNEEEKEQFIERLLKEKPSVASIEHIAITRLESHNRFRQFSIVGSDSISDQITGVSPDIGVCDNCLKDMKSQKHRIDYPFINCTHCGPRFSIIKALPYDREQTSMNMFHMCDQCQSEYSQITDRRFHAQPVACNHCGPRYYLTFPAKGHFHSIYCTNEQFFQSLADAINKGKVISMKGLGGYNIICDAFQENAVKQLRQIKERDSKPFAILFRDITSAQEYVELSEQEKSALLSWQRPIVLVRQIREINPLLNCQLATLGILLPYLPAHYLLFEKLNTPALVYTSGNLANEPIIIDNRMAQTKLLSKVTLQGEHNREIVNRVDDSIIQFINNTPRIIRRSRGYVPKAFHSELFTEGILACGGEKVNTFSIGKGESIMLSQYIGDLENADTIEFYKESIDRFRHLYRFTPNALACDMHPDYYATQYAEQLSDKLDIPLYKIQHHHAHAVACMEENHLTDNMLSIILDGTGYGTDSKIWGGEFLICNHLSFIRDDHFDYIPLPGAEKAIRQPWRTALSILDHYHIPIPESLLQNHEQESNMMLKMIHQQLNSPLSCGAGRLFDAASALLGCCMTSHFQAEAPLRLEHLASDNYTLYYDFDQEKPLDNFSLFEGIVSDLSKGRNKSLIAAKFHNTLVKKLVRQTQISLRNNGLPKKVILSGGCFQNRRISQSIEQELCKQHIQVFTPHLYPANDSGISLGQLAIAATIRNKSYA